MNRPQGQDEQREPKPFDFVPFAEKRRRDTVPGHDAFRKMSGRLEYDLVVIGMVHVSSGTYALASDVGIPGTSPLRDHYRVMVKGERKLAIPGSTLKGAARAIVEAVTESCLRVSKKDLTNAMPQNLAACQPPRPPKPPQPPPPQPLKGRYCPACAVFGAMSQLGRVRFGDAVLIEGDRAIYNLPQLHRPRPKDEEGYFTPTYADSEGRFYGRKFYYHGKRAENHAEGAPVEVLKPNSRLRGVVEFESLSEAELGLLLFGMGLDNTFRPLVGAGKPLALGKVRPEAVRLTIYRSASFLTAEPDDAQWEGEALAAKLRTTIAAAESLILDDQRDELRRILDPRNPRPAPTGMY